MTEVTGLQIARSTVRVMTLSGRPGRLRPSHLAEQAIEDDRDEMALARAIQAVLPATPRRSPAIQVVLGADLACPFTMKAPVIGARKLRLAIPFEADRLLENGAGGDHLYGHRVMARKGGVATVWACATSRARIEPVCRALRQSGLEIEECLVESFATAQLVASSGWCSPPHLWCHRDGHDGVLMLLRAGLPPIVRSLKLRQVTPEMLTREAVRMGHGPEESGGADLTITITGNESPEGQGATNSLVLPHGLEPIEPRFLPAAAAALRGFELLDPGPVLETSGASRLVRTVRALSPGIAAFLLGLTLLALAIGYRWRQGHEPLRELEHALVQQQDDLFTQVFPNTPAERGSLPDQLRHLLAELERARAHQATRHSALELLDEIVTHLPSSSSTALRIKTMHVEGTDAVMEARGQVTSGPAEGMALAVEKRLRESDRLEANAENITVDPDDPTRVTFRVRISRRTGGSP